MDNLFIVRSPLQIINSLEAIEYFNLENNILILIYNNTNNNNVQMDALIAKYEWKEIIQVNIKQKKSKYFEYISFVRKMMKKEYNYLFFSNLGSIHKLILANLKRKHAIYIDDGVETITRYNNVFLANTLNQIKFRQLRFLIAGLKIKIPDNIDFFTYFDLAPFRNSKIIKNNLCNFRKKYLSGISKGDDIYFLGQPLVKTNLVVSETYFDYLNKTLTVFSNHKIIYIPHRNELISDRLKSYESENFEIRFPNMPFELYLFENRIYPQVVVSFLTTSLFTLRPLFPETLLNYIYIPKEKILERQDDVQGVYDFIQSQNIPRLDI